MRYIGSKLRLVNFIESTIKKYCGEDLSEKIFCDIFAGTGVVGRQLSKDVKKVIANDLELYSYIANYVQLNGYNEQAVKDFFDEYNKLSVADKFSLFYKNRNIFDAYSENGAKKRLFFSEKNGYDIQVARNLLFKKAKDLSYKDYFAILYSIMEGADKIANTMSTYGMFASKIKENAKKDFALISPKFSENINGQNEIYMEDSNKLIKKIKGDILYLDPPYNSRQYSSYYFVLNAIARNLAPETDTKSGVKNDECNKSSYNKKKEVFNALKDLIENANFEWIFLSYNNEGLLTFDEIKSLFEQYGDYSVESTDYQRYKADNNRVQKADKTIEYIHVLHKGVFTKKNEIVEDKNTTDSHKKFKLVVNALITEQPDKNGLIFKKEALEEAVKNFNEQNNKPNEVLGEFSHRPKTEQVLEYKEVTSPMNYMGGKKKLLGVLLQNFPKTKNFVDLFCGGATVGINSSSPNVLFNDIIEPLIKMYEYMYRTDTVSVLKYIEETIMIWNLSQTNKEEYYEFREHYNNTPEEERHPLDLFVLMAYSFNNQIRFNDKKKKFNVPFGENRSSFNQKMKNNLIKFVDAIHEKNCYFRALDFNDIELSQQFIWPEDTFVYVDPPYLISQATYNNVWDEKKEKQLLAYLHELDKQGYRFALSNVLENKGQKNTILEDWINKNNYNVLHIEKSYANSYYHRKEKESKTDEVLITNYDTPNFDN